MAFAAPRISARPSPMASPVASPRSKRPTHQQMKDEAFAGAYFKYGSFGSTGNPSFRSREFVKIIKDACLMSPSFNIYPPNRVDFVYGYACVHGPGGFKGNKNMSLDQFAYATKGIAHETGLSHAEVLRRLIAAEPSLNGSPSPLPSPRRANDGDEQMWTSSLRSELRSPSSPATPGRGRWGSASSQNDILYRSSPRHLTRNGSASSHDGHGEWTASAYGEDGCHISRRLSIDEVHMAGPPPPQASPIDAGLRSTLNIGAGRGYSFAAPDYQPPAPSPVIPKPPQSPQLPHGLPASLAQALHKRESSPLVQLASTSAQSSRSPREMRISKDSSSASAASTTPSHLLPPAPPAMPPAAPMEAEKSPTSQLPSAGASKLPDADSWASRW